MKKSTLNMESAEEHPTSQSPGGGMPEGDGDGPGSPLLGVGGWVRKEEAVREQS